MELTECREHLDKIDKELASLFEKRMEIIEEVRKYKLANNLPILDAKRENSMQEKNRSYIKNEELFSYYSQFLTACTTISKQYMMDKSSK